MDDDLFSQDYKTRPGRGDNLFGWTVFMLLLIGFALGCWIGSYYLFGHPENPRSYKILWKLKKVDAPKRFELTAAPPGEFLNPQKLFDRYATYTRLQLENENAELMRNYIGNYQGTKRLVPYVIGRFNILDSFELNAKTIFPSGVVALAQAVDYPQILIEHAYTAPPKAVSVLQRMLMTGLDIKLERTLDLSAIIHVTKLRDGRLQFTAVPLTYGSYALKQGSGSFSLEPPPILNMEAGVPILQDAMLQEASKTYAQFRKKTAPSSLAETATEPGASPTPARPELVRAATPTPEPTLPPERVAKAIPLPTPVVPAPKPIPETAKPIVSGSPVAPKPRPIASPSPTPVQIASLTAKPTPKVAIAPSSTPAPTPSSPTSPQGVPLQPFLAAAPTPNPATSGGTWKVFPPGQMPRGRLMDPQDMAELAERGTSGERLYLRGQFVVTASSEGRAVLRSQKGIANLIKPGSGATRVIVEFPSGATPPSEGSSFTRDENRPFQITDVRRGADGQINVYVREITAQ